MFCKKCGTKNEESHQFCVNCGDSIVHSNDLSEIRIIRGDYEKHWWYRLLKVAYVFFYLQIIWIVMVVWGTNSSSYISNYSNSYYEDTYAEAFWYSILTIMIFIIVIKLIKIAILYIAIAKKPEWKKEFKKFY